MKHITRILLLFLAATVIIISSCDSSDNDKGPINGILLVVHNNTILTLENVSWGPKSLGTINPKGYSTVIIRPYMNTATDEGTPVSDPFGNLSARDIEDDKYQITFIAHMDDGSNSFVCNTYDKYAMEDAEEVMFTIEDGTQVVCDGINSPVTINTLSNL